MCAVSELLTSEIHLCASEGVTLSCWPQSVPNFGIHSKHQTLSVCYDIFMDNFMCVLSLIFPAMNKLIVEALGMLASLVLHIGELHALFIRGKYEVISAF